MRASFRCQRTPWRVCSLRTRARCQRGRPAPHAVARGQLGVVLCPASARAAGKARAQTKCRRSRGQRRLQPADRPSSPVVPRGWEAPAPRSTRPRRRGRVHRDLTPVHERRNSLDAIGSSGLCHAPGTVDKHSHKRASSCRPGAGPWSSTARHEDNSTRIRHDPLVIRSGHAHFRSRRRVPGRTTARSRCPPTRRGSSHTNRPS